MKIRRVRVIIRYQDTHGVSVFIECGNFGVPPVKGEELLINCQDYIVDRVIRIPCRETTDTEFIVQVVVVE